MTNLFGRQNLPLILVILDGWGVAPPSRGNAITLAKTPVMDHYASHYPMTLLHASGSFVGLPKNQEGNSEAGHSNLGAGRVVEQDAVRISETIDDGTFFKNPAFIEAIANVQRNGTEIHLMGLLSNGSSAHSDPKHLRALIDLLKKQGIKKINLHLFTDGRDSPRYDAIKLIRELENTFTGEEQINTIMGRFFVMDRKKYWPRTELAYNTLVMNNVKGVHSAESAEGAILEAYNRGESDEFIEPCVITKNGKSTARINHGDSVIFFNLRSDRARQIAKVFVQEDFTARNPDSFTRRKVLTGLRFAAMTDFGPDLDHILTAYPSPDIQDTLPMQFKDFKQLYIAETEKYAHVTFFFNGGYSDPVAGEERTLIPSPNVKSYDETPAMSSAQLAYEVIGNLKKNKYDITVLNFAAPDMIGHTGNLKAAISCIESVDHYLGKIIEEYLKVEGTVVVTADHGNIEEMINLKTGEINTEHTTNKVPFIIINKKLENQIKLLDDGCLGDVAATILKILDVQKPKLMNRKPLF
jgi:2,3-bisphosphoglycerate-independent phosphoglycerate mutase